MDGAINNAMYKDGINNNKYSSLVVSPTALSPQGQGEKKAFL
jgi:hypothetical protein